ncbi:MAG: hypothetical protein KIT86_06925 [Hydrogenophaga sp.]|uniref:hypothetical protein n=1 Tax=Hydrogenophaga sp. TaxID=1904254 RepID=UPI0026168F73|nr:hypothetical protein [Hydrogenophaga sp.]MCW5669377.1 hypothetical protein [Hydrogenophaga sp.]
MNTAATAARQAVIDRYFDQAPSRVDADGSRHWATRGANFIVVVTHAAPGCVLDRTSNPDEYMLLLPENVGASLQAGGATIETPGDSLSIFPPGASRITVKTAGYVYRIFSHLATDLLELVSNPRDYDVRDDVAPLVHWPEPVGGFKLRHYPLANYVRPENSMRLFRSSNLMINIFLPQTKPRDPRKMTPHSHADFEQGSLSLSGSYVHHLRYPWTSDLTSWREDDHALVFSPSLCIMPAKVIHTSQAIGTERTRLVDIFCPPREDFSLKPGLVNNADEYPMPASVNAA